MPYKSCGLENLHKFGGEIAIQPRKNLDKQHIYARTEIVVCLNCSAAQFAIQEAELRLLQKSSAARAG